MPWHEADRRSAGSAVSKRRQKKRDLKNKEGREDREIEDRLK
jgi:hypothetical protein